MKWAVYSLALLSLACSKKDPASEIPVGDINSLSPLQEAEQEARPGEGQSVQVTAPQAVPPTVKLIDAGAPPLRRLRWEFRKGAQEVLEMESSYAFQAKAKGFVGAATGPRHVLPSLVQTVELAIEDVSSDGLARVAFQVTNDRVLETPNVTGSLSVTGAKGTTGSFRVDSKGVVSECELAVPEVLPPGADLEYVQNLLRLMVFPVPDEPIGAGAKWSVARVVERRGIPMNEQVTLELVELAGSEVTLTFELESQGSRQTTIGAAENEAIKTEDFTWEADGRTTTSLTRLVPRSLTLGNQLVLNTQVARPSGAIEHLDMNVDRRVEIRPE